MALQLNQEWSDPHARVPGRPSGPRNQTCHSIGIPLIAASIPVGATLIGLPLAATMFSVGWAFQFAGHAFEGKKPSFVEDKRAAVGGR